MNVELRNLRQLPRFVMNDPLAASFAGFAVRVLNVSGGGLLVDHADALKVGMHGSFKIAVAALREENTFPATIVWSHLSKATNEKGKLLYNSGLRIDDPPSSTLGFLGRLIRTCGREDRDSMERKRAAIERRKSHPPAPPAETKPKYTPEQLLMIQQARVRLARDAAETQRLYELAKISLTEKDLPVMHKRDALAIWKYLGEEIDLDLIATVINAVG